MGVMGSDIFVKKDYYLAQVRNISVLAVPDIGGWGSIVFVIIRKKKEEYECDLHMG